MCVPKGHTRDVCYACPPSEGTRRACVSRRDTHAMYVTRALLRRARVERVCPEGTHTRYIHVRVRAYACAYARGSCVKRSEFDRAFWMQLRARVCACACARMRMYARMRVRLCAHACACACMYARMRVCAYACAYACVRTHARAHVRAYARTRVCARMRVRDINPLRGWALCAQISSAGRACGTGCADPSASKLMPYGPGHLPR